MPGKSILVPISDNTPVAHRIRFARQLFGEGIGGVTVLRTYLDLMGVDPLVPMPTPGLYDVVAAQVQQQADDVFLSVLDARQRVDVVVSYGPLGPEVERLTATGGFAWVVVGTAEDEPSFKEVAGIVVKASRIPVLVVPERARFRGVQRILVADDDGDATPSALLPLVEIARIAGAEVVLVRVLPPGEPDTTVNGSRAHHALLNGIPHSFVTVHSDDVAQAISEQATRSGVQVVVLLHRHRGVLGGLFHHSLAKEMADDTAVPLIVLEQ